MKEYQHLIGKIIIATAIIVAAIIIAGCTTTINLDFGNWTDLRGTTFNG